MSNPIESFTAATSRGQEATTAVLRSWTDGLQAFSGGQSGLSDLPGMVSRYFDAVQQVLDSQRQFVEAVANSAQGAQSFMNQALRATQDSVDAAQSTTDGMADLANAAKSQTRAMSRVAKAATS